MQRGIFRLDGSHYSGVLINLCALLQRSGLVGGEDGGVEWGPPPGARWWEISSWAEETNGMGLLSISIDYQKEETLRLDRKRLSEGGQEETLRLDRKRLSDGGQEETL
ncbi:unnamed protein product [Arctogadus glacialis]